MHFFHGLQTRCCLDKVSFRGTPPTNPGIDTFAATKAIHLSQPIAF